MRTRLDREKHTLELMIKLYCRVKHNPSKGSICPDCSELLDYAFKRVDCCKFASKKPVCARCNIHCYTPEMRKKIKDVMITSGPRIFFRNPIITLMHMVDVLRFSPRK